MSDLVFEKLSQALGASESWRLNIAGDFFRLSEAAYPVSVSLIKGLRIVGTMRNMLAGDYVRDIQFDGVIIDNGAVAQSVSAQIAGGGAGSDRVIGEVSVINGELARVEAGRCFVGVIGQGATAGQLSIVQIWNPVASGKKLVVNKISAFVGALTQVNIQSYATPMAVVVPCANKRIGGAAGVGEMRAGTSAASVGSLIGAFSVAVANQSVDLPFSEPFVVPPGQSICLVAQTVNVNLQSMAQWNEEVI